MRINIKIRIIFWAILLLAIFWFLAGGVVPSGEISYSKDFKKENDFIQKLSPAERVQTTEDGGQRIIANPVYFSLRTPRTFDQAKVTIRYKNDYKIPLIELGTLVDNTVWRYDLKPIENSLLDDLETSWQKIFFNGVSFYQKNSDYGSIESFLSSLPDNEKIATYNYFLKSEYKIADYSSSSKPQKLSGFRPLQGGWQALTYISGEDIDFKFVLEDQNHNDDQDSVEIFLYYKNEIIDSLLLEDTEDIRDQDRFSAHFKAPNLPEGVYKIELKANDDIITNVLITPQTKFSLFGKFELAKKEKKNFKIFTDSQQVSFTTVYPDRLQTIELASTSVEILQTYKQFSSILKTQSTSTKLVELSLEGDGLIMGGDGAFAFAESAYFNPNIQKAIAPLDFEQSGINYVISRYQVPENSGEWKVKTQSFDLKSAYREKGKYSFIISVPDLKIKDEKYLEINEIKVHLSGRTLIEKIKEIIN